MTSSRWTLPADGDSLQASLAKMLQLELAPQSSIDPSYIRRTSAIDDSPFFVSVGGEVRKELPRIVEPRSGIL